MADEDRTARLALALLQPGQAQKEMTHNEALAILDLVVQARAVAAGLQNPPEAPELGACWIVGDAPGGAWTGCAGMLAGWTSGGWRFVTPIDGMQIWLNEAGEFLQFSNGAGRQGTLH